MTLREKQLTVSAGLKAALGQGEAEAEGDLETSGIGVSDPLLETMVDDVEALLLLNSPEQSRQAVAEMVLSQRTRGPTAFSEVRI